VKIDDLSNRKNIVTQKQIDTDKEQVGEIFYRLNAVAGL
jgi:hypothetical protein